MKKDPTLGVFFHTVGGIRTHDPLLRRQLLYPTELLERCGANIEKISYSCQFSAGQFLTQRTGIAKSLYLCDELNLSDLRLLMAA